MDDFNLTQEQVAAQVGKDRTTVANALRLLKLPEEIRAALAAERITEGHARALLTVAEAKQQRALLENVIAKGYSVRQTEEAARRANEKGKSGKRARPGARAVHEMPGETRALEDELRRALGTKVQVFRSREGGKIVLHFYSEEELEALFDKLVGKR